MTLQKKVRKASTSSDEGSCSSHVNDENRMQQEASATTSSRVHRLLAQPGQEAGAVAAASQVHHQL